MIAAPRRCLLVSSAPSLGLKTLYCLAQVCETVDVWASSPENLIRFSRFRGAFEVGSLSTDAATLDRLVAMIKRRRIEAVLPDGMEAMAFLHSVQDQLPAAVFAPTSRETLKSIHDKWTFYQRLSARGLATPRSKLLERMDELTESFVTALGFPLIVKPLEHEASHGVVVLRSFAELDSYVRGSGPYRELPLLLQEFIPGSDIDFSAIRVDRKIIACDVQSHSDADIRVFTEGQDVVTLGAAVLDAFDFDGVAHIDMRIDARTGKVCAIECNPRFWMTVTASMWRGLNFPYAAVRAAAGYRGRQPNTAHGAYYLPGWVARSFLRPWRLAKLDNSNWRGFVQAVSDPTPHLASLIHEKRVAWQKSRLTAASRP